MALLTGEELAFALNLDYEGVETEFDDVSTAACDIIGGLITTAAFDEEPMAVRAATLSVGVEIYQARTAAGGQPVGVDLSPGPYRLSVWLTRRVMSLLGPYMNAKGMVG